MGTGEHHQKLVDEPLAQHLVTLEVGLGRFEAQVSQSLLLLVHLMSHLVFAINNILDQMLVDIRKILFLKFLFEHVGTFFDSQRAIIIFLLLRARHLLALAQALNHLLFLILRHLPSLPAAATMLRGHALLLSAAVHVRFATGVVSAAS